MAASTVQLPTDDVSSEDRVDPRYVARIERLVELSEHGHDAFEDVDWDGLDVDRSDPRLRCWDFDPLTRTDWYRSLSPQEQADTGRLRIATNLRIGWEFENLLQQGLLTRALRMKNTDTTFRYLHTEVMEESQHTLMFFEFVRRHAENAHGMPRNLIRAADALVHGVVRTTPTFFYFMVLGGELPVDHLQRLAIKQPDDRIHPLIKQIMQYHVEEEARHVSFASEEIRRSVPNLNGAQRHAMALALAPVMAIMARLMINPSPWLLHHLGVPKDQLAAAYAHPESRKLLRDSMVRIQRLVTEVGLMTPPAKVLWKRWGIWSEPRSRAGARAA